MSRQLTVLDNIRIASPCTVPWSSMQGDDRTRHCGQCNLNVFNVSNMTRAEAETLFLAQQGRLCIGFYQRADGTILTSDCPVGVAALRRKLYRTLLRFAAVFAFLAGSLHALARGERGSGDFRLRYFQPFTPIIRWLTPPPQDFIMGDAAFDLESPSHAFELESPEAVTSIRDLIAKYNAESRAR